MAHVDRKEVSVTATAGDRLTPPEENLLQRVLVLLAGTEGIAQDTEGSHPPRIGERLPHRTSPQHASVTTELIQSTSPPHSQFIHLLQGQLKGPNSYLGVLLTPRDPTVYWEVLQQRGSGERIRWLAPCFARHTDRGPDFLPLALHRFPHHQALTKLGLQPPRGMWNFVLTWLALLILFPLNCFRLVLERDTDQHPATFRRVWTLTRKFSLNLLAIVPRLHRPLKVRKLWRQHLISSNSPEMRSLSILTYNIRGLTSRARRVRTRLFIEGLRQRPDLVCLQEHKLRLGKTDCIRKEIWAAAHWVCAPAADGAHAFRNLNVESGKGGVALGFHMDLIPFKTAEGMVASHRAVWACFDHPAWGKLGFFGIYGPNESAGRTGLWSELGTTLDSTYNWMFLGDFNMIELHSDQVGGDGHIIRGREARAWTNLTRTFNLTDSYQRRPGHLKFSWDNQRLHRHHPANFDGRQFGARTLRRLDRIYAPRSSRRFTNSVSSTILPGFALSDHAPVLALLTAGETQTRPSRHRMNSSHLLQPVFKDRIRRLLEQHLAKGLQKGWDPERILSRCLKGARKADRCWGKRRAKEKKQRQEILQARVQRAQLALEQNPDSIQHQLVLDQSREMLLALDKGLASWVDQVIQARWAADGDRCSKLFFKSFKSMASSKKIHSVLDSEGNEANTWEEMAGTIEEYFRTTLGGPGESNPDTNQSRCQASVLEHVEDRLTEEEKLCLNAPFSLVELEEAVLAMKKHKCPGADGTPVEFLQQLWTTLGPLILQVLNLGIQRGRFQPEFTLGLIVLLPKKNDQRLLTNKRPITLLNAIYKLGAKVLQRRLTLIL